jgi:hypothetical protein
MNQAIAWVEAHPLLMTAVVWPFLLALVTALLKPRTPEQYAAIATRDPAWFFERWAECLRLIGAIGIDPIKVMQILKNILNPGAPR